jgi:hypothetical protein
VIGTLELRRMVSGTFALCMMSLFQFGPISCCVFLTALAAHLASIQKLRIPTVTQAAPVKGFQ